MPRIAPLCMPTVYPTNTKARKHFAVQGRGYCYCSWAGNRQLWI
jgi:hypothetical protein